MKRLLSCLVVASILTGILSACGKETAREDTGIKIGVTVYDQYDTFIGQLLEQFSDCASEREAQAGIAINLEIYNASDSQSTQNSQVETMINDGCNVVCVNLVDRTDPTTIIDMAKKSNVPVIFFNRELVEEDLERWNQLYYVGAEAFESGIMQGEMVADTLRKEPSVDRNGDGVLQYVVLEGEAGHQDTIVRTEYAVNTIAEEGFELEKLGYAIANWNREQAQTKMTQMIHQFGTEIELVLSNNDDMALGAIDALKEANIDRLDWPIIVGIDGTDVGLEAVKNGDMIGTVYNDKDGQAEAMLNLAYELSTGGSLEDLNLEDGKYIRLPYAKVTQNEVDTYMEAQQSGN